jgi:hypothetical protein
MVESPPSRPTRARRLRPVLFLLLALIGLDLGVLASRNTWERYSPDDYLERVRGCAREPRDFVIIGGSPVSEGLDPALVAGARWRGEVLRNGYALGLPGGTTSEAFHALRHGCPTPPRLVVYGVTASDLNDARNEPHGPYSIMTWADWAEWARDRPESRGWVTRRFLEGQLRRCWSLYRYRHGIRMWSAAMAESAVPGFCPEAATEARGLTAYADALRSGNGYAPAAWFVHRRYDLMKADGWVAPPFEYLHKFRTGAHLTYLHRIADWCDERNVDLVLLDMPVTADLEARHPDALAEYRRRLAELEAGWSIPVLRATREQVGVGDAEFADMIHLNVVGMHRLSAWLRDRLNEQDHPIAGRGRP